MEKKIIAKFDNIYAMTLWVLQHPEYSDCAKYPTEIIGNEYFIVKGKTK